MAGTGSASAEVVSQELQGRDEANFCLNLIPARYELDVSKVSTWVELGLNVVQTGLKLGLNLGQTWFKLGLNLVQTLSKVGLNLV